MIDEFEKIFGKEPEEGYEFINIEVEVIDNDRFKGLDIAWLAKGLGFGHVTISWGIGEDVKKTWPDSYGFHTDTECMSKEFVEALLIAAAPKMAKVICEKDKS